MGLGSGFTRFHQDARSIKGYQFNSQSKSHAWVTSQVFSRGRARGNHTMMFLSFSVFFPSPLSKNEIKSFLKRLKKMYCVNGISSHLLMSYCVPALSSAL